MPDTDSNGNGNTSTSTQQARFDGALLNSLTGLGVEGRDRTLATTIKSTRLKLEKEKKESLFAIRILRKICSVFPTEAVRKGWVVKLGGQSKDPKIISDFNLYQTKLQVKKYFAWAKILANAYDGAVIVINVEDGQSPDQPIRRDRIRSVKALYVLDRYKIKPELVSSDPQNPDYYSITMPVGATTQFKDEMQGLGAEYRIHPSRIIRFDGVDLLPDQMLDNEGWGGSVLEQVWDAYKLWESTHQSIAQIVQNYDVMIYGLKGLSQIIANGNERQIKTRLSSLQQTNSILGGIAIDSDSESLNSYSRNVSGLPQVGDIFRDRLIGESEVSHTFLFGESPSGLGATGESEEKTDAKKVHAFQEEVYRPRLEYLAELIWLAKDGPTKGRIPDDWRLDFVSLLDEKQQDIIDARGSQANTDRTYLDSAVLLPEEIRQSRFGGSEYSYETVLDERLWEQKQQEQQNQFAGFGGFGEDANTTTPTDETASTDEAVDGEGGNGEQVQLDSARSDSAPQVKRVVNWQGLSIGITHEPGDRRFPGLLGIPMQSDVSYGHIRRSYPSAPDKKALDVYFSGKNSDKIFKIRQLTKAGLVDEPKYCIGFETIEAARDAYLAHAGRNRFGGIENVNISELTPYQAQKYHQDACDCEKCTLARQRKKRRRRVKSVEQDLNTPAAESTARSDVSEQDLADLITEQAIASTSPTVRSWVNKIDKWLDGVESLKEARDRLTELYDLLDGNKFATSLMNKRILADLGGRLEILQEAEDSGNNSTK